jgi:hypothetical protein
MRELLQILLHPITWYKDKQRFKKRLAELRKRDPFIYK